VLESQYKCSGLCKPAKYFTFTNVQNGPPLRACESYLVEDFSGYSGAYRKYAKIYLASAGMVLLSWLLSFGVCFRLRWDHRGSPLALEYVIKRVTDEDTIVNN
jgi:hypothetical protein